MKKLFVIVWVLVLSASCGLKTKQKPQTFLEKKEFAHLLAEIHLSDGVAEEKAKGDSKLDNLLAAKGLDQILKNHNLSHSQFDSVFNFYISDPALLEEVYTDVLDELSRKQAELVR